MSRIGVTLINGISTGPRDGAGLKSWGPGVENLVPTHPYNQYISANNKKWHAPRRNAKKKRKENVDAFQKDVIKRTLN